jgi:hypothetical protein
VQPLQDLAQDRGAGVIVALDRALPQRVAAGTLDQDRRPLVGQQAGGAVTVPPAQQAMAVLLLGSLLTFSIAGSPAAVSTGQSWAWGVLMAAPSRRNRQRLR